MAEFNIGRRIVEHALEFNDLKLFTDAGLDSDWIGDKFAFSYAAVFEDDSDRDAYRYLLRYQERYGRVPGTDLFHKNFPSYNPQENEYDADELISEAHRAIREIIVEHTLSEIADLDREGQHELAMEKIRDAGARFNFADTEYEHLLAVQSEVRKLRVQREARILLEAEGSEEFPISFLDLTAIQALDTIQEWRVDDLIARGTNTLINAQAKAGKTTLVMNLVRCLAGRESMFLGELPTVRAPKIRVVDFEMPPGTVKRWLSEFGLIQGEHVEYALLMGRASAFNVLNERVARTLEDSLRGTDVLIIDPLGPLLAAMGLDENKNPEVRRLLNALTELKERAGIGELILVHHAGHGMQRSRGASVFNDWPDALVNLTVADPSDQHSTRTFTARGRDVWYQKELKYNDKTRELVSISAHYTRRGQELADRILAVLADRPMTTREIRAAVGGRNETLAGTLAELVTARRIRVYETGCSKVYELIR